MYRSQNSREKLCVKPCLRLVGFHPLTIVGSVSARDADTGRNADIMYFFPEEQFEFDLDPFTGELRSKIEFNREIKQQYSLRVQVRTSFFRLMKYVNAA